MNVTRGCLIATVQVTLTPQVVDQFRRDLLARLRETGARRVIIDCSGVEIVDAEDFARLRKTVATAALLGARTTFAGLRPGVVSALVDLGVDLDGIDAAADIDDALRKA
jgi:anti-anti-sigma regulatory factor